MRTIKISLALGALALSACNSVELGYVPLHVPVPDVGMDGCTFSPMDDPLLGIRLDVAKRSSVRLSVAVMNELDDVSVQIDPINPSDRLNVPRSITPLRFDFRWECESQGFQGDVGPLILPAFSNDLTRPFCINNRDETVKEFSGFDVVPASGGAIPPGESGIVRIRPVPAAMGLALREFFALAVQAEACCTASGGCNQIGTGPMQASCTQLQTLLDQYSGDPGLLNIGNLQDVNRFRPFYRFTDRSVSPDIFPMRLSGFFEGIMPNGDLITSSQFNQEIGFCSGNCGAPLPMPGEMPTLEDCYTN